VSKQPVKEPEGEGPPPPDREPPDQDKPRRNPQNQETPREEPRAPIEPYRAPVEGKLRTAILTPQPTCIESRADALQ
jgi:hypothetical protein